MIAAIAVVRSRGEDIKKVWKAWSPTPNKPRLANQLWPLLSRKIEDARCDNELPMPQIAEVVFETHRLALQRSNRLATWSIRAASDE